MPNPHRPRKRFGQHFLTDARVIERIIHVIQPASDQHLVEIGPGQGVLTAPLIDQLVDGRLDLIELDRDLVPLLAERFADRANLHIHQSDILAFDCATLCQSADEKLRVVGNLPYNISTPLLFHLFERIDVLEDMHFMLQKEVVDRMVAVPGERAYGRLSVMVQYDCVVEHLFDVPPGAFRPSPRVMSSIVRLKPLQERPVVAKDLGRFQAMVSAAFNQRRKMLSNSLSAWLDADSMSGLGIDPCSRPEGLSVWDFVRLSLV